MTRSLLLLLGFLAGAAWARAPGAEPARAAPAPPDFASVVAACDGSVVEITTGQGGGPARSRDDNVGSGFVVAPDGWILTNRHVVAGAREVEVRVPGRGAVRGSVAAVDEALDVALVRVPLGGLVPLPPGDPGALRKGEWVLCAGSPYRLRNSWSVGIVSGLGRSEVGVNPRGYQRYIQTDAAANLGNSGGPLVNARGQVVGVMTAILSRSGGHMGVSLAVPIDAVMERLATWRRGAGPARIELGASVRAEAGGLRVTRVEPDSPAARAGLVAGDLLLLAAGRVLRAPADLQEALWALAPGASLSLRLRRGPQVLERHVTLR